MPLILRNLPYFDEPTSVEVRGQSLSVKRDQIVLWISIAEKGLPKSGLAHTKVSGDS